MNTSSPLRWGILSTGRIARAFAESLTHTATGNLVAVGSRTPEAAAGFAADFDLERAHGTYQALIDDPDVDVLYIATPHPQHARWAIRAANAGKHLLCEKPLTMNYAETMAVMEAVRANDVFLMEGFMYRCHPQIQRAIEQVRSGVLGEIHLVQASYGYQGSTDDIRSRHLCNALGGGAILDVGCYAVSFARLMAGVAAGRDASMEPELLRGCATLHPETGVDTRAAATLRFPGGLIAEVAASLDTKLATVAELRGSEGWLRLCYPWARDTRDKSPTLIWQRLGEEVREETVPSPVNCFTLEAEEVARHIEDRQAVFPAMRWGDTLGNMKCLDWWLQEAGVTYDTERIDAHIPTVHGYTLTVRPDAKMPTAALPGLDLPMSRLVMGCDSQCSPPHASILFDAYFESGGNVFDTAHIYGGGRHERMVGQWIMNRAVREEVAVIGKGGHTPHCLPEHIIVQLETSLDRLHTDHVDLYLVHRDNLDLPIGELIDVLHDLVERGWARAYGVSNWSLERLKEGMAYAEAHGRRLPAALSNNFSLARMANPEWPGCMAASDPDYRAWLAASRMPLLAWSSQANGFFVREDPGDRPDRASADPWHSDDNRERKARAAALAAEKGVSAINVALAYVLRQPFPLLALIGPRTLEELRTSLPACAVELTDEEMAWLDLGG